MIVFHIGFPKTGTTSIQSEWKRFVSKDCFNPVAFDRLWKELYYDEFFTNTFKNSEVYRKRVNSVLSSKDHYLLSYESALGFNPYWSSKRLEYLKEVFRDHEIVWLVTLPQSLTGHASRVYRHKLSEGFVFDWRTFQSRESSAHSGFSVRAMKYVVNHINELGSAGVIFIKPNELLKPLPRLNASNTPWIAFVVNSPYVRIINSWFYGNRWFGIILQIVKYLKRNHEIVSYPEKYKTLELGSSWLDNFQDDILTSLDKGTLSSEKVRGAMDLLKDIEKYYVWNFSRV
jgi:hypothetical protein